MAIYSLVNNDTGEVVNNIEVDPEGINYSGPEEKKKMLYIPPEGFFLYPVQLPIGSFHPDYPQL